jgi:hypothetical protein
VTNDDVDTLAEVIWALAHGPTVTAAFREALSEQHRTTALDVLHKRLEAYNNRVRHIVEQNRQRAAGSGERIPGRREALSGDPGRCLGKALSKGG